MPKKQKQYIQGSDAMGCGVGFSSRIVPVSDYYDDNIVALMDLMVAPNELWIVREYRDRGDRSPEIVSRFEELYQRLYNHFNPGAVFTPPPTPPPPTPPSTPPEVETRQARRAGRQPRRRGRGAGALRGSPVSVPPPYDPNIVALINRMAVTRFPDTEEIVREYIVNRNRDPEVVRRFNELYRIAYRVFYPNAVFTPDITPPPTGRGLKPEPRPMEGGSVCCICKEHLDRMEKEDEMEGNGIVDVAKQVQQKIKQTKETARKGASKVKKAGKKAGDYITDVDGLASDVVNYGIPATTGATLGALGSLGGPVAGIALSALGSKLGTMASDKIADETKIQSRYEGGTIKPKRKAKFEKGSEEAKKYMAELRAKRTKK
jgi:hypothetical protein